jgi:hypothetical protein
VTEEEEARTRQERRARKLHKKREQIRTHGKNLAKVYMDAILKRLKRRQPKEE